MFYNIHYWIIVYNIHYWIIVGVHSLGRKKCLRTNPPNHSTSPKTEANGHLSDGPASAEFRPEYPTALGSFPSLVSFGLGVATFKRGLMTSSIDSSNSNVKNKIILHCIHTLLVFNGRISPLESNKQVWHGQ